MPFNLQAAGVYAKEDLYIAFTPAKEHARLLVFTLSTKLRELRENGRLQDILDRYGLEDWHVK